MRHLLLALPLLTACHTLPDDALRIHTTEDLSAPLGRFVEYLPWDDKGLEISADPASDATGGGLHVAVLVDRGCAECWELELVGDDYAVHAGDLLGAQYGLADLLEGLGFRFHHPFATHVPEALGAVDEALLGVLHEPEMKRRGLQLHTLHPIEALYDFYMPYTPGGQERAMRVMDWIVKNRGNHVQWISLDDLELSAAAHSAWVEHTAPLIAEAHERGLTVSTGVQLYGAASLQRGFDLLDNESTDEAQRERIRDKMSLILRDDLPWDMINLSFGEFVGDDPADFIAAATRAVEEMQALSPGIEVGGKVHVGADLVVEYEGEELIFYFLADQVPNLVPWVHTVMYYNLFDDPGGSYHHENYDAHRDYLIDLLEADRPVVYFPESAYWVAFDSPVPTYLPVYIYSRWRDQQGLRDATDKRLQDHVLFTSGWEWGYWQNDVATLRMNYEHPANWGDLLQHIFAPHDQGAALASALTSYSEDQYHHLIGERMGAYMAGVDSIMVLGYSQGIVSQPRRTSFAELANLDATARQALANADGPRLDALATDMRAGADAIEGLGLDTSDPFLAEVVDGVQITALRAEFVRAMYRAAFANLAGEDPAAFLAEADAAHAAAREVVDRRHDALWYPQPELLIGETDNPTLYQYGYLIRAEQLCFWERERAQYENVLGAGGATVPGCAL